MMMLIKRLMSRREEVAIHKMRLGLMVLNRCVELQKVHSDTMRLGGRIEISMLSMHAKRKYTLLCWQTKNPN